MSKRRKRLVELPTGAPKRPAKRKLLFDRDISASAPALVERFHFNISFVSPKATDDENIARARAEGRMLVSANAADLRQVPLRLSPGILLVHGTQQSTAATTALLTSFFAAQTAAGLAPGTPLPFERVDLSRSGGRLRSTTATGDVSQYEFKIPRPARRRRR